MSFDLAFTSVLKRAIKTLWVVLEEMDHMWIPVTHSWRLNERHYGALQGLNKAETAAKFGEAQVKIWRRAYETAPPPLEDGDPRLEISDPRYAELEPGAFPRTECLRDTVIAIFALLARNYRAGNTVGKACDHRSPWQQFASTRKVPRRHFRYRHRRTQHSYGSTARL